MKVIHDIENSQFKLILKDDVEAGYLSYELTGDRQLSANHTVVNPEYKGNNYGQILLDHLVSYAEDQDLKIIPVCPYITHMKDKFPDQYAHIIL